MAFKKKFIDVTFELGQGQYGTSGGNTQTLKGLRTSAKILNAAPPAMSSLQLDVFGMTLDQMNALNTLGMVAQQQRKNVVTISAYEDGETPNTVFQGTIFNAWMDPEGSPETVFHAEAQAGLLEAIAPVDPTSYKGSVDAVTALQAAAKKAGFKFENNGVSGIQLSSSYFSGSGRDQIAAIATNANVGWIIENSTLAIWTKNQHRNGDPVIISPSKGNLVSYPTYTSSGIRIKVPFNPSIKFAGQVTIDGSALTNANNTWTIYRIDHDLEANYPSGRWFSTIDCYNPAYPAPAAL